MINFPQIATERLLLGPLRASDLPTIVTHAGNRRVADPPLNIPHPYQEADAIFWINSAQQGFKRKSQYTFAIRLQATGELIGGIGLRLHATFDRAELGYWVGEPFWNRGYATEAAAGLLQFGFEQLGLHKIFATYLECNPASGKVMRKNGMVQEGILVDHTKKNGQYRTLVQCRLTKTEYARIRKP